MLRTIFSIGLFTLVGIVLLGVAFTLFGVAAGVAIAVLFVAIKVLIIGAIVYGILCIVMETPFNIGESGAASPAMRQWFRVEEPEADPARARCLDRHRQRAGRGSRGSGE